MCAVGAWRAYRQIKKALAIESGRDDRDARLHLGGVYVYQVNEDTWAVRNSSKYPITKIAASYMRGPDEQFFDTPAKRTVEVQNPKVLLPGEDLIFADVAEAVPHNEDFTVYFTSLGDGNRYIKRPNGKLEMQKPSESTKSA